MDRNEALALILAAWREKQESGDDVSPEELIDAYPEFASELRSHFQFDEIVDLSMAAPEEELPTETPRVIGDFRILSELGRGGMGVVYEAEQVSMGRRVALKLLSLAISGSPQAVKRFQREARAAGRMHHTNIVPIYAMGNHSGYWYYAMELVEGIPLSQVVEGARRSRDAAPTVPHVESSEGSKRTTASDPFNTRSGDRAYFVRVAEAFAGVAEALQLAHDHGVVHRDMKPSNLLLDVDGTVKIVDFGLARLEEQAGASMTMTGDLLGTPLYMSPEQAMAKRIPIDHRTDIYSLGATLYEVLTLSVPFDGKTLQEVCSQIITKDPVLPRRRDQRIPRDLETVLLKAMEKDRDKRYQSAGEMARDLRRFAEGMAIRARRIGVVGRTWRKVRRRPVRAALIAAVVVLLVVGGGLGWKLRAEGERRRSEGYARLVAGAHEHLGSIAASSESPTWEEAHEDRELRNRLAEAVSLAPERPEAYWLRALTPGRLLADRLSDLAAARERGLSERTFLLTRALLHLKDGDRAAAEREAERAARMPEGDAGDAYFEAEIALARGDRERADALLERTIEGGGPRDLSRALALRRRARLRTAAGDFTGALDDLYELRRSGDAGIATQVRIASLWRGLERHDEAEKRFEEVRTALRRSGDPDAWRQAMIACRRCGEADWGETLAREAMAADPDSPDFLRERVGFLVKLERAEEALVACEQFLARHPESGKGHLSLARSLHGLDRNELALDAIERAIELLGNDHAPWHLKAEILSGLDRHEAAAEAYARALELDAICSSAWANRAVALTRAGRLEEALESNRRAIALEPSGRNWTNRAFILMRLGRPEECRAATETVLTGDPDSPEAWLIREDRLMAEGRYPEAVQAGRRVIELGGGDREDAYSNLCTALIAAGEDEEAERVCEAGLERFPKSTLLIPMRGFVAWHRGRKAEGMRILKEALDRDPESADVLDTLARVLLQQGKLEEAERHLRHSLAIDGPRLGTLSQLGTALLRKGNPEGAVQAFEKACALDPSVGRLVNLALAQEQAGEPDEAEATLLSTVRRDPNSALAHRAYGGFLNRVRKQHERALAEVDRAIELADSAPVSWRFRATILSWLERPDEAVAALREAGRRGLDPGVERSLLLQFLVTAGRKEEADRIADEIERDLPADEIALESLLFTLPRLRRSEAALRAATRLREIRPGFARAWIVEGGSLLALRRPSEAVPPLRRGLELSPRSAHGWQLLANALLQVGKRAEALEAANRALEIDPDAPTAHVQRGFALSGLNRDAEALAEADRVLDLEADAERSRAILLRGFSLAKLERWADAASALGEYLEDPGGPYFRALACFHLAHCQLRLGAEEDARASMAGAYRADPPGRAVLTELRQLPHDTRLSLARLAAEVAPGTTMAHVALGEALSGTPDQEGALAAFTRAAELEPEDGDIAWVRAQILLRGKRLADAVPVLRVASAPGAPRRLPALRALASCLMQLRRFQEALAPIEAALALDQAWPSGQTAHAQILFELNRFEDALAAADAALALTPGAATALLYRGWALQRLERAEDALRAFRKLESRGNCPPLVRVCLADSLIALGNYGEALAEAERAIGAPRLDRAARFAKGRAQLGQGDAEAALATFDALLREDPEDPAALGYRAMTLDRAGRFDDALGTLLEAAERLEDPAPFLNSAAWMLLTTPSVDRRDPERACDLARRALELEPDGGAIHGTLGTALFRIGKLDAARESLEKAISLSRGSSAALDRTILVMVLFRQGEGDAARAAREKADAWFRAHPATQPDYLELIEEASALVK